MTKPVHILKGVPDAGDNAVAWEAICRNRTASIIVRYAPTRLASRWRSVPNKRPFKVGTMDPAERAIGWRDVSSHTTLDAAMKAAHRMAK